MRTYECTRSLIARARSAHEHGDPETAFRLLEDPRFTACRFPGACYLKARMAMSAGLWDHALSVLEDLMVAITPRRDLSLCRIECLISLGRFAEAEHLLEGCGEDASCHSLVLRARVAAATGENEATYRYLVRAMKLDPETTSAMAIRSPELAAWALGAFRDQLPSAIAG